MTYANIKLMLWGMICYFPLAAAVESVTMQPLEMVAWASLISFIGGCSAAWRTSNQLEKIAKSGTNTMILGASFVLIGSFYTADKPAFAWVSIGISGLLSLGGLATVDWLHELTKKHLSKRVENESKTE